MHRYIGIQSLQTENLGSGFGYALISLMSNEVNFLFKCLLKSLDKSENT